MNDQIKLQLANLYAQKGELTTEIEVMQTRLQQVNQHIIQVRNAIAQESREKLGEVPPSQDEEPAKENTTTEKPLEGKEL